MHLKTISKSIAQRTSFQQSDKGVIIQRMIYIHSLQKNDLGSLFTNSKFGLLFTKNDLCT